VRADDGCALKRHYLVEGVVVVIFCIMPRWSWGNTRSRSHGSGNGDTFNAALPLGTIILENVMLGGVCRWNGVSSTVLMAAGLGDVVQRNLGAGRMHDDGCEYGGGTIFRGGAKGRMSLMHVQPCSF
jgi:hypothetical protein